jgi:outer membrane protein insertion porin family
LLHKSIKHFIIALFAIAIATSCSLPIRYKKTPKGRPYVADNTININDAKLSKDDKDLLKIGLRRQLEDSLKITVKEKFFVFKTVSKPPAYDSQAVAQSAENMRKNLLQLGYYRANVTANTQFKKGRKAYNIFNVQLNKPTVIDTVNYVLRNQNLQNLANNNLNNTLLNKYQPFTKSAATGELARLVALFRENGYYKITTDELKLRGDTSIAALTEISDDPFESIELLAAAAAKANDTQRIKLAVVLKNLNAKERFVPFKIGKVNVYPDFFPTDSAENKQYTTSQFDSLTFFEKRKIFTQKFVATNIFLKPGQLFSQTNYSKTLSALSARNVWQNVNITFTEQLADSTLNVTIELIPAKLYSFESSIDFSYSANANTNTVTTINAGNLLGIGLNAVLGNKNLGKQGINFTNRLRFGIEANMGSNLGGGSQAINSNELAHDLNLAFPRFIFPFKKLENKSYNTQSFINTSISYANRFNLYNLNSVNLGVGYSWLNKKQNKFTVKPINIEFARLFNTSANFEKLLDSIPFLRYSFNTSFAAGISANYTATHASKKNANIQTSINLNFEESGYTWSLPFRLTNVFSNTLRQYIKTDVEYKVFKRYPNTKNSLVWRTYLGIGISSRRDSTLPFFKQYFAGGPNSMRAWPVRGVGRGSQAAIPFNSSTSFNDRTGDIRFETNLEYRFNILTVSPNFITLRGALFADVGNIWNLRNSKLGSTDSTHFEIKNLYRDLGVGLGGGLRVDFTYILLRFDLGFRFKRPELAYINNGWRSPNIGFDDAFSKLFSRRQKQWRYENVNFSIGIDVPF